MKAEASFVRIEGSRTNNGNYAWLDTADLVHGYGAGVYFHPDFHHVVVAYCEQEKRYALIAMPGPEWEDSIKEGWKIVQRFPAASKISGKDA